MNVPSMIGRRHLLTRIVPGITAGILVGAGHAMAEERVVYKGKVGTFCADGETPTKMTTTTDGESPIGTMFTQRYEDLTAAEMVSMTVGIPLQLREPHQASRIMQLSLDLEHFIAVVPLDPKLVDADSREEIRKLRDQLTVLSGIKVLLHLFGEIAGDKVPAETIKLKVKGS